MTSLPRTFTRGSSSPIRIALRAFLLVLSFGSSCATGEGLPISPVTLEWGGFTWSVRNSYGPSGPRDNYFNPSKENVYVDEEDRLHLAIRPSPSGLWQASEIILKRRFGYGTYEWQISSPLLDVDPSVVLGLFTWSNDPRYANREIDIEFSAWGDSGVKGRGQFVVQPYQIPGNIITFPLDAAKGKSVHTFTWLPDRVEFSSRAIAEKGSAESAGAGAAVDRDVVGKTGTDPGPAEPAPDRAEPGPAPTPEVSAPAGLAPPDEPVLADTTMALWTFSDSAKIPKPGNEYVHINFYLIDGGKAPSRGEPIEMVLDSFRFIPYGRVVRLGGGGTRVNTAPGAAIPRRKPGIKLEVRD